jgi:hypothetical protein
LFTCVTLSSRKEGDVPGTCKACDRLWQELNEAIRNYLKLVREMQIATSQQNSAQIAKLDRALTEAISNRDGIRAAIAGHEATHPGRKPAIHN